jgi:hypothetical protein
MWWGERQRPARAVGALESASTPGANRAAKQSYYRPSSDVKGSTDFGGAIAGLEWVEGRIDYPLLEIEINAARGRGQSVRGDGLLAFFGATFTL